MERNRQERRANILDTVPSRGNYTGMEEGGRQGERLVSGCRAKLSHLKNDRPRVLYRARDGADETLEKESRAVRASSAFSQICGPRDRPSAYLRPGGPPPDSAKNNRRLARSRGRVVVFEERG